MLSEEDFGRLVDEIVGLGYEEERAAELAGLIGDTPVVDDATGEVVVREGASRTGEERVTRLRLRFFTEGNEGKEG